MPTRDTASTSLVLFAFQLAWRKTIEDYERRQINSEQCMQASLYRHLKNCLPTSFSVFSEAVVRLGENAISETNKQKVVVDLLICEDKSIVAGIEIKYAPRGAPDTEQIRKDLTSLSHITIRRRHADRVKIEMPRFRHVDSDTMDFEILLQRKLIFAAFCSSDVDTLYEGAFWTNFRPIHGYWKKTTTAPPNLCVALAHAAANGTALPTFFGPAFERIRPADEPLHDDA